MWTRSRGENTFEEADLDPNASWRHPAGDANEALPDHPVVHVTWHDAVTYCAWARLRLPSEAEWERAARSARAGPFPWGREDKGEGSVKRANLADLSLKKLRPLLAANLDYDDGFATTSPVGAFPLGASAVGALDMIGNVEEWCEDLYESD